MKALVTGLSESKYFSTDYDLTVGVNDCPFPVDHLIVSDHPQVFKTDRLKTIIDHPAKLFTHIPQWSRLRQANMFRLASKRSDVKQLKDKLNYCFSICSPFIAVVHAFYQGATEIHLAGVDIVGHKNLGRLEKMLIIQRDFFMLYSELDRCGCELSLLKSIPDGALVGIIPDTK